MNDNIIVSVLCTAYNHEAYIRQCLDGFVMQKTDFKYEVIIHDDASTDKTAEIIRGYEEQYPDIIKPIYQKENQYSKGGGIYSKYMYPRAKGKYIAICEGDDYWIDPYKLQKQVDFLESHPDYSMCFHKANIVNELNRDVPLKSHIIENREYIADELFSNWIVPTASMVYRKEILNFPYKKQERMLNGDINIVLTCAMFGKIRAFNDTMSVYRMQSSGVTYDKKLQIQRALKYPDHFLYLKDNFSILIDRNTINYSISQAYFRRIFVQDTMINKMKDLFLSFYYYPIFAIKALFGYLKMKICNKE